METELWVLPKGWSCLTRVVSTTGNKIIVEGIENQFETVQADDVIVFGAGQNINDLRRGMFSSQHTDTAPKPSSQGKEMDWGERFESLGVHEAARPV
jgi:hypothetical protein